MMADLRRQADAAAQAIFHEAVIAQARDGRWNTTLVARYVAAERLVDQIDAEIRRIQEEDPDAPDYFGTRCCGAENGRHWAGCGYRGLSPVETESELRAAWGDR